MIVARTLAAVVAIAILGSDAGCPRPPGKPVEKDRWKPPSQVTDFRQLNGRGGVACVEAAGAGRAIRRRGGQTSLGHVRWKRRLPWL